MMRKPSLQQLKLTVVTNVDCRSLDGLMVDERHSSTTIGIPSRNVM